MLQRLGIERLAFIETAELLWDPGLNILTGETGAGKSLLIESLGTLLGYRGDLPPLTEKAIIEAEFAPVPPQVQDLLEEPAETLLVRCELHPTGRRRLFLNDSPVSAQLLRQMAYYLVEIHSQHDTQQLFQPPFQRELLDSYAELSEELTHYQTLYRRWKALSEEVAQLKKAQAEIASRLAWLRTQLEELESAQLSTEEYAHIETQIQRLEHQEQALQTLSQWFHQLSEAPQAPPALLREAEKALGRLPLPEIPPILSLLEEARSLLQEATAQIETLLSSFSIDPTEAQRLRQRYDTYNTLLLKYRAPTVEALITLRDEYRKEYNSLSAQEAYIEPAHQELQTLTQALLEKAYALELARLAAAHTLADQVQAYLHELGLGQAHFHIAVERLKDPNSPYRWQEEGVQLTPYGFSSVTFLLRTHPQLPLAPLAQVASGGELSRIMLALKAALAEKVALPTLVLDEIDTGLSGESARRMGTFLSKLSKRFQILLITHLPAIAAQPGSHFFIWKAPDETGSWKTHIRKLTPEERIPEIARMLGGEAAGEAALAAARELLHLPRR
ncbi:MAG: DNA repair protein RecN [Bacteroidia bacterium]|nr:DNA repair protein RecN [Bacteroidia bacterium]GIV23391.1 MAG: DNA repair protein RecN [Bacteroidia bacterium]